MSSSRVDGTGTWKSISKHTIFKRRSILPALDPLREIFDEKDLNVNSSMAKFVDVVHTSGGNQYMYSYGVDKPLGHVDFYMNGGKANQPGCAKS